MHPWLTTFTPCEPSSLTHPLAVGFLAQQAAAMDGVFAITGAMRREGGEMLLATINTERPQRPVVDIRHQEEIGIFFGRDDYGPGVLVFRDDFPDTPHQALNPVGIPFSICIDDRPWSEVRLGYTPAELGMRILQWFRKAARGELHDPAQPMEPVFALHDPVELIMPRGAWGAEQGSQFELAGYIKDKARPNVVTLQLASEAPDQAQTTSVLAYDLSAQSVSRMRRAPATLQDLQSEALKRGVDLLEDLGKRIHAWYADSTKRGSILKSLPCFVVRLPLISPLDGAVEGVQTIAFIAESTVGDIGSALGIFFSEQLSDLKTAGYQLRVRPGSPAPETVHLFGCLVHAEFDTHLARVISGRRLSPTGRVAMIGGGAIGSSVAESLVREGAFDSWSIIDDDTFLPHNLARHTLSHVDVSHPKAVALGIRLKGIRPDLDVMVFDENFLGGDELKSAGALDEADVIIDASASVAVGRSLSDRPGKARRLSIFFNPTGTAAVLLAEDAERRCDLRFLEALYHRAVLTEPTLETHLRASETIRYTGACRMLTSRIPASRIQVLSGLVADGVAKALEGSGAVVQIWSLDEDGAISVVKPGLEGENRSFGDWLVRTPRDLVRELAEERDRQLPNETGGALLGIVDPMRKRVDLVAALKAPADSSHSPTEFTRGTLGLRDEVDHATARCADQIRYVGEWHSHPLGSSSHPSSIDLEQLAWLTRTMAIDGMPALMFIVAENGASQLLGMT